MTPTLQEGQIVLGVSFYRVLRPGDIVIFAHGGIEKIKRIQQRQGTRLYLCGDNSDASTDSRSFGWLDVTVVRAKVIWPRRI